jgi:hypothetical protein
MAGVVVTVIVLPADNAPIGVVLAPNVTKVGKVWAIRPVATIIAWDTYGKYIEYPVALDVGVVSTLV